jgi:hypothetical protein
VTQTRLLLIGALAFVVLLAAIISVFFIQTPLAETETTSVTTPSSFQLTATSTAASTSMAVLRPIGPNTPLPASAVDSLHIIPVYDARFDAVHAPTGFGTGNVWHVGPTREAKRLTDIAGRLAAGDVVEIDAGTYKCEQSIVITASNITLIGIGGRAVFDATGCTITGDKGILNPRGTNLIVDNLEFVGAKGKSGNDAGIRYDGAGYLYITHSYFHDNQNGILYTPTPKNVNLNFASTTDIVIDHSEFSHNGSGSGSTHNIYISSADAQANSFVMRYSYSHDAVVGHEVKSRAKSNYILNNRLEDGANGNASYQIDIPQGGLTYITGNYIQKGPKGVNGANIEYGMEPNPHPVQELHIENNTIVNMREGGSRTLLVLKNNGNLTADIKNNVLYGFDMTKLIQGPATLIDLDNNTIATFPPTTSMVP